MSIIIEDGSGRADAEAYVAVAFADGYHARRGNAAWAAAETAAREAALVRAADHLDQAYRFRGERLSGDQALAWPRGGAEDDAGRTLLGVPEAVKRACAELALRALTEDLAPDQPRGGMIVGESVGPVSVSYASGAPAGTRRPAIEHMLRGVVRAADLARA